MKAIGLIEYGFVTRALEYSDGRQCIEIRGDDTNRLYTSTRDRHDRTWSEGDLVGIYKTSELPEKVVADAGYQNVLTICYRPPGEDGWEPDDSMAERP